MKPVSKLDEITPEQEKLYQKCHEEGYDLEYFLWLKAKNLHVSDDHNENISSKSAQDSTPSVVFTCAPDSVRGSLVVSSSVSTSDVLGDLLTLPQPKITKRKRKPRFNQKAVCITDKVLQELQEKKEIIAKWIEREKRRNKRNNNQRKKKEGGKKTKDKDQKTRLK